MKLINKFFKRAGDFTGYIPMSPWETLLTNIRSAYRDFVTKRKASGIAFYLQSFEDTEGNYYRRLQQNGQFDTIIYNKYMPDESEE